MKRCDNCFFSIWMMSPDRPKLACKQKAAHPGRWWIVRLDQSCPNFYPSSTFKAGSQAARRIPLTRGKFALVDAEDYYQLAEFNWQAASNKVTFYACGKVAGRTRKMHRLIMNAPDHLIVDHIDHNGLNNAKSNLRLCTTAQNAFNVVSIKGGSSRYKGISWEKKRKKWRAAIQCDNKKYVLGYFENEIAAAKAYDEKASEFFGEFAHLNFPLPRAQRDTGMTGEKMNIQQFFEGYHLGRKLAAQHRRKEPAVDREFFNF